MKKLTIGRNNSCDIIIPDTSDLVSRKQAVLACSFFGKMVLYDTSNNGTYVNGQKLENGKGVKVTRKDKVNFARIADLDWNEVRDPYKLHKMFSIIAIAVVVVVSLAAALWLTLPEEDDDIIPEPTETVSEKGGTVSTVEPQGVEEQPQPKKTNKTKRRKTNKKKDMGVTPQKLKEKEVNDNTPIVY